MSMASQTRIEGVGGLLSGFVEIGQERVQIHRDIHFTRDIDGSWSFLVMLPEDRNDKGLYSLDDTAGGMRVSDPAVTAFIGHLARMIAYPEHYAGDAGFVTIGQDEQTGKDHD